MPHLRGHKLRLVPIAIQQNYFCKKQIEHIVLLVYSNYTITNVNLVMIY